MKTALGLIALLCFGLVPPGSAQNKLSKRFNVWYFGVKGGLSFNQSAPQPLSGGQVNGSEWEGCATMCDEAGNLLFYTDGVTIRNRNHQPMAGNSYPGNLGGHSSATQSGLIVPHPGNENLYYVFSVYRQGLANTRDNGGGVQFAEVDMSQTGGLGQVISKNAILPPLSKATEKLLAVQHCNGKFFWVIAHEVNSNRFVSYLVGDQGLQKDKPIYSSVGSYIAAGTGNSDGFDCIGYLKASQSGNRVAAAISGQNAVELFNFDNSTGLVSNPIRIEAPFSRSAYGIEFSPNGKLLYVAGSFSEKTLYQVDITKTSRSEIEASAVRIGQTPAQLLGGLQIGPDGKIYIANQSVNAQNAVLSGYDYLGVINQPDERGSACDYLPAGIALNGGRSTLGLPNLIAGFCRKPPEVQCQQVLGGACGGGLLRAVVTNTDTVSYQWFREGVAIAGATQATYKPLVAGKFRVEIKEVKPCPLEAKSNEVSVSLLDRGSDLKPQLLPKTCGTFLLKITAAPGSSIQWSGPGLSGLSAQRDTVLVSGPRGEVTYRVSVTNPTDPTCKSDTSLKVNFAVPPPYQLPSRALSAACGQSVALNAPVNTGWDTFRWRLPDGQVVAQNPYVARTGGTYVVLARSGTAGCESRDSVVVSFQGNAAPPQVSPPFNQCAADPPPTLSATGENITWYADSTLSRVLGTGNRFQPILTANPGRAVFFATQTTAQGCASRAAKTSISVEEAPKLGLEKTVSACFADNQSVLLDAGAGLGWRYQWQRAGATTGATQTLPVRAAGLYRLRVTSPNGCASTDSVLVVEICKPEVFVPDVFTPNGDGINDSFAPKGQFINDFELVVYNRWGEAIHTARGSSFETAQPQFWGGLVQGQLAPPGVYAWRLRVSSAVWVEPFVKYGFVTLSR